jgi:hypothetical protein
MKISRAILYSLVTLILVFSIAAALSLLNGNNNLTPNNTKNTQTPINTQVTNAGNSIPDDGVRFSYTFSNFEKLNIGKYGENKVNLSIKIDYQGKIDITINYSQFYITLYIYSKTGEPIQTTNIIAPQNQGSITLGPSHSTEIIQLTFQYPAAIENDKETATTYYHLQYKTGA